MRAYEKGKFYVLIGVLLLLGIILSVMIGIDTGGQKEQKTPFVSEEKTEKEMTVEQQGETAKEKMLEYVERNLFFETGGM